MNGLTFAEQMRVLSEGAVCKVSPSELRQKEIKQKIRLLAKNGRRELAEFIGQCGLGGSKLDWEKLRSEAAETAKLLIERDGLDVHIHEIGKGDYALMFLKVNW